MQYLCSVKYDQCIQPIKKVKEMKDSTWLATEQPNPVAETEGAMKTQFVPSGDPVTPEEAARYAAQAQAGIHAETMLAGFDQMEQYIFQGLLNGRHYKGRYYTLMQTIRGTSLPGQPHNEIQHKLGFNLIMTAKLKDLLKTVKVVIMGQKDFEDFAKITAVEDAETERTDGFVTPGDEFYIHGEKIKVVGEEDEDGVKEAGIGVFFIPDNGGAPIPAKRIRQNQPAFLSVKTPNNLSDSTKYTLRVITRYSGFTLLKTPRIIDCHKKLFTQDPPPAPTKVKSAKVARRAS
jgi:hypothetical protein